MNLVNTTDRLNKMADAIDNKIKTIINSTPAKQRDSLDLIKLALMQEISNELGYQNAFTNLHLAHDENISKLFKNDSSEMYLAFAERLWKDIENSESGEVKASINDFDAKSEFIKDAVFEITLDSVANLKNQIKTMDSRLNGEWMLDHLTEIAERLGDDVHNVKDVQDLLKNILNHTIFVYPAKAVENKDYQVLKKIALVQEDYDPEKDYNRYFEITGTSKDDLHYLIDDPDVLKFKVDDMYVYSI